MSDQLPESMDAVLAALRQSGDTTALRETRTASRGGVSATLLLETEAKLYFLKWNERPEHGTFTNEAFQLSLLRQTNTVCVPVVVGTGDGPPAWMLQEWAGTARRSDKEARLGRKLGERLAQLHASTADSAPGYGYVRQNEDGSAQLPTQSREDYLYEAHLRPHIERARRANRWTPQRNERIDRFIERLPSLLAGVERAPTLLHGDLHSGNIRLSPAGEPVLVDPWLFYGDREIEIVSTYLSGDFGADFYDTYNTLLPLDTEFKERIDAYKLVWFLSSLYYSPNPESQEHNSIADPILAHYVG